MVGKGVIEGQRVILAKPQTFMNLSGESVRELIDYYKVDEEQELIVVSDDTSLDVGSIRIRKKGSAGGHNGLKNIQLILNSSEYPRLRFGISDEFKKGQQVDYVLGDWSDEETTALKERLDMVSKAVKEFALAGLNNAMNNYNGK